MSNVNNDDFHCIDTRVFDRCIQNKDQYIRRLAALTARYESVIKKLQGSWQGDGADMFFSDAQKVRTNLTGISDILGNMCSIMVECRKVVEQADKTLGDYNRNPGQE